MKESEKGGIGFLRLTWNKKYKKIAIVGCIICDWITHIREIFSEERGVLITDKSKINKNPKIFEGGILLFKVRLSLPSSINPISQTSKSKK